MCDEGRHRDVGERRTGDGETTVWVTDEHRTGERPDRRVYDGVGKRVQETPGVVRVRRRGLHGHDVVGTHLRLHVLSLVVIQFGVVRRRGPSFRQVQRCLASRREDVGGVSVQWGAVVGPWRHLVDVHGGSADQRRRTRAIRWARRVVAGR